MTHHAILYRRAEQDFLDVTIETTCPTGDFTALRRQRFLGVCFCGRHCLSYCRRCGWHTPHDRELIKRDAFQVAMTEDGRVTAMLRASLRDSGHDRP